MTELENNIPQNEEDVDNLLSEIEAPQNTEMEASPEPAQAAPQEYSFKYGGKEIKAPIDKIIKWAEMGYDAPNKIGELNKTLESYKQKEGQFSEWQKKYGAVDDYVRQNPQWWEHVSQQFQQVQAQQQTQSNPLMPVLQQLTEKITGLEGFKNDFVTKQEDAAYNAELDSIKKQYPKVDFDTPDAYGKSLEYKILEHAQANGLKQFKTAFRDFYHDEILKLKEEEAKEKLISDRQQKSKLGILGISSTPTKKISNDVRGKTYGDLEREALEELGIR